MATKKVATNIVSLADRRPKTRAERMAGKSFYEIYPMPFFNSEKLLAWDVQPSGSYTADIETGREYAQQFLATCDMTNGWSSLLPKIANDMVAGGSRTGTWPDGRPRSNGVVIGFMGEITGYVMWAISLTGTPPGGAA